MSISNDYLEVAQQANSPIMAIFETHVQADHLSGAPQLAAATRAPIYLHESARVEFPFIPLKDGDVIELGNDYVRVLHTPGHSPDSVCLLVGDRTRTDAPWLIFTGDTLFVGDVGRPDLHGDRHTATFASQLYDRLLPLLAVRENVPVEQAAVLGATYLGVWGISQRLTGPLSYRIGRKPLITGGLWVQAVGIALFVLLAGGPAWPVTPIMMALGTGMVYQPCWPPSVTWRTRHGGHRRSASIVSGTTAVMRGGRWSAECWLICYSSRSPYSLLPD